MGWNKALPLSGSKISVTPTVYQDNWNAMDDILGQEHYAMTTTLSGRHKPGYVGSMYVSAEAAIAALSSPQTGALAWITDTGSGFGLMWGGAAWTKIHYSLPTTRVIVAGAASVTVPSATYGFFLSGGTETVDTLSEFNSTTGVFSACGGGNFVATTTVAASTTVSAGETITLGFCGSSISESTTHILPFSGYQSLSVTSLVSAASGVKIAPYIYCDNQSISISGGTGITYGAFYRTS